MVNLIKRKIKFGLQEIFILAAAIGLVASFALPVAALSDASLTLGDSRPGETATYTFDVSSVDTGTDIACAQLDLGANSDGSGAIAGLDTSSSTLDSDSIITGTSVDNTGSGDHILQADTGGAAVTPSASGTVVWGGVVNGSTADTGYYGVFSTYEDSSCTTLSETITVQFIYTDGQTVTATVDSEFSFTVAGVAGSETVNSATTTEASTATTIPFGNVGTSQNEVVAQDLTVSTNAVNGYSVYMRTTGALASGGDDIDYWTGTHATPTTFPGAGTDEAFGYTTDDTDVGAGAFGADEWAGAGFEDTTNDIATESTGPVADDVTRAGYQVAVDPATISGSYQTTIIYTAVPTY